MRIGLRYCFDWKVNIVYLNTAIDGCKYHPESSHLLKFVNFSGNWFRGAFLKWKPHFQRKKAYWVDHNGNPSSESGRSHSRCLIGSPLKSGGEQIRPRWNGGKMRMARAERWRGRGGEMEEHECNQQFAHYRPPISWWTTSLSLSEQPAVPCLLKSIAI